MSVIVAPQRPSVKPPPPMLLYSLTPELEETLKLRWLSRLTRIISKNSESIYFEESPLLAEFRAARSSQTRVSESNNSSTVADTDNISDTFALYDSLIPFSTYADYYPYISRLFTSHQSQCPPNLLSPGLPVFVAHTSGTTGAEKKYPKYPHPMYTPSAATAINLTCKLTSFRYYDTVSLKDGDGMTAIPVCPFSTGLQRTALGVYPKDDGMLKPLKGASHLKCI